MSSRRIGLPLHLFSLYICVALAVREYYCNTLNHTLNRPAAFNIIHDAIRRRSSAMCEALLNGNMRLAYSLLQGRWVDIWQIHSQTAVVGRNPSKKLGTKLQNIKVSAPSANLAMRSRGGLGRGSGLYRRYHEQKDDFYTCQI